MWALTKQKVSFLMRNLTPTPPLFPKIPAYPVPIYKEGNEMIAQGWSLKKGSANQVAVQVRDLRGDILLGVQNNEYSHELLPPNLQSNGRSRKSVSLRSDSRFQQR